MNRNLHDALHSLAATGGDASSDASALALAERSVSAVERRHRRRPVIVVGLTGVGVLTAGAAAALGYSFLQDDHAAPFPDRLTPETTMPSSEPVELTCGADVADLVATDGPVDLGSESVDAEHTSPLVIAVDPSTTIPLHLSNTTPGSLTFAPTDAPGIYLVRDGLVVAVPAADPDLAVSPPETTLDAGQTLPLSDYGVVPCPDSGGTTPEAVPVGNYDAYGTVDVIFEGSTEPLEVVGGPWPVRVEAPVVDPPVLADPPGAGPAALPAASPDAVFPECGAILDAPTGMGPVVLRTGPGPLLERTWQPPLPLGPELEIARAPGDIAGPAGEMGSVYLVAVKDGVVVGGYSAEPSRQPFSVATDGPQYETSPATVVTSLCSDPGTPLPEGRYSMWAAQDFTITSGQVWEEETVDSIPGPIEHRAVHQVATLWMDGAGQSVEAPPRPAGWPTPLAHEEAFGTDAGAPETVVWLATTTEHIDLGDDAALVPVRDALADLSYPETDIPLMCQSGLDAVGISVPAESWNGYGIGVVFATAEEAQSFVALWEPLHGPVLGTVTSPVGCAF